MGALRGELPSKGEQQGWAQLPAKLHTALRKAQAAQLCVLHPGFF